MNPKYTIGIATTKNENRTLVGMISTLEQDISQFPLDAPVETIICLNNYNNESEQTAEQLREKHPLLGIVVTDSEKGIIPAQRKIILSSRSDSDFVIFFDSDVSILPETTKSLVRHMEEHPEVHAVSGDQRAYPLDSFAYGVYNIIGLNPQIMTPRKYITGRDFAIRKESYFVPDFMYGEDTFLSHSLMYEFGLDSVQTERNANVLYMGPRNMGEYINKRKRLILMKETMFREFPEFRGLVREFKKTKIPSEIAKLSAKEKLQLFLHDIIKKGCMKMVDTTKEAKWITLQSTKDEVVFEGK